MNSTTRAEQFLFPRNFQWNFDGNVHVRTQRNENKQKRNETKKKRNFGTPRRRSPVVRGTSISASPSTKTISTKRNRRSDLVDDTLTQALVLQHLQQLLDALVARLQRLLLRFDAQLQFLFFFGRDKKIQRF